MSLIYSIPTLKRFYNTIYQELKLNEVHFISLAARNKYLTEKEKEEYRLGKTQMVYKTVLREYNFTKFLAKLQQIDASADYYLTLNGEYLPKKCCVIYANINPNDTIKSTAAFKKLLADYDSELFNISVNTFDKARFENAMKRYNNLHNNLLTCYQNNRARKIWVDIDIDSDSIELDDLQVFVRGLNLDIDYQIVIIKTYGGFHFLMRTRDMNKEYNPGVVVNKLSETFKDVCKEIVINKNEMVPIPGTYQGMKPVEMYVLNTGCIL